MVMVKARQAAAPLVPSIRAAVASVDPSVPIYDVLSLDDRVDAALGRPRFNAALAAGFAAAALALAAIGTAAAIAFTRLLQGLLAGVAPTDPRALGTAVVVMLAVAAAAAWLPARRAAAVDPIVVLRAE